MREHNTAALAFYVAFLDGLPKEFFPELAASFHQFAQAEDWNIIDQAISSGYRTAAAHAVLIMDLYQKGVQKNDLKWTENQIQKQLLGKYVNKK